jgi:hypothetical protein
MADRQVPAVNVSAIIVTRGDVDLVPVLESLPESWQRIVWDNGAREVRKYEPQFGYASIRTIPRDLAVYGRYAAIEFAADGNLIYVQDDDCILDDPAALHVHRAPGYVVCNLPTKFRDTGNYEDSSLVGFGALFDRYLPVMAFGKFFGHGSGGLMPSDAMLRAITNQPEPFLRECDTIFTGLTPRVLVDLPYSDREFASAPNRLWKQPGHAAEREGMRQLVRQVRDAA